MIVSVDRRNRRSVADPRPVRADAQRNLLTLLQAAKEVFAEAGTEAPVRVIAERAGVGVGTVYRHFPTRADLVAAVFAREIDTCADDADRIAAEHTAFEALRLWVGVFVTLASIKRGLARALQSGDPAFDVIPAKREQRLFPAFRKLFEAAVSAGEIHTDVSPDDVLNAVATLCMTARPDQTDRALNLVMLLVDGLRCRADR
ncbi:TetR/AcrR family transcriptional regulator [Sphingomonas bacterium]|uniref:TetR/AcrR family transcriptional regulator n=1 Tax=Sphingomonas bacterium TaxID=1895847 RepID=UPI00157501C4|nr:TetR/AcrR family transcriptional regulator [Sphingomonas bacterium]